MIISTQLFRLLTWPVVFIAAAIITHPGHSVAAPDESGSGVPLTLSEDAEVDARSVRFGLKAGVCFSRLYGDDPDFKESGLSAKSGFAAGCFVRRKLKGAVGLESDIMFAVKGYEWGEGTRIDGSVSTKYIEIPLLLTYDVRPKVGIHSRLSAGPYFGVLVSARASSELDGFVRTADVKSTLSDFDWGGILGAGVDVPKGGNAISLEGRIAFSLADLMTGGSYTDNQGIEEYAPASTMKLWTFTLLVGFSF